MPKSSHVRCGPSADWACSLNILLAYWAYRNYEADHPPQHNTLLRTPSGQNTSKSELLIQALKNKTTASPHLAPRILQSAMLISTTSTDPRLPLHLRLPRRRSQHLRLGDLLFNCIQERLSLQSGLRDLRILVRTQNDNELHAWSLNFARLGITIGRFTLTHLVHRIGEKTGVVGLIIGATIFQLLVWLVPNVVGNAVAVSIVGLLLGPIYPASTAVYTRLLDKSIQISSLAVVSALGSSGGAVAPFFTGLLAQQAGTWVLNPISIGLFAGMVGLWVSLPRLGRRTD